jgi:hypothetical protein
MTVFNTGNSKSGKLKHMAICWHFIHSKITAELMELVYILTQEMVADILTKPLIDKDFTRLRDLLLNRVA